MAPDPPLALAAFVLASAVVIGLLAVVTSALLEYASRKYGVSENDVLIGDQPRMVGCTHAARCGTIVPPPISRVDLATETGGFCRSKSNRLDLSIERLLGERGVQRKAQIDRRAER